MKHYYDTRAAEYDEWYLGLGRFDGLKRPHWDEDLRELEHVITALPPARNLDAACGTGFLTRHLHGEVTALDQSERMLAIARARMPTRQFVCSDPLDLPFATNCFARVFIGHFYGHLDETQREQFLAEARRVAQQLIVVDSAQRPDVNLSSDNCRPSTTDSSFRYSSDTSPPPSYSGSWAAAWSFTKTRGSS